MEDKIRIFIADDHEVLTDSLKTVLSNVPQFDFVGRAHDGDTLLANLRHKDIDVLLLDICMPGVEHVEFVEQINKKYPKVKVVVLTSIDELKTAQKAIQLGARGYLAKRVGSNELVNAILGVANGRIVIEINNFGDRETVEDSIKDQLTKREKQVICLRCKGFEYREIAGVLNIAEATVEKHKQNAMKKLKDLGITNDASLGFWAAETKLIEELDLSSS